MLYNVLVFISCTLISTHKTTESIRRAPPVTFSPLLIQVSSNLKCLWPLTMLTTPFLKFISLFFWNTKLSQFFSCLYGCSFLVSFCCPLCFHSFLNTGISLSFSSDPLFFPGTFPHFKYSFYLILSVLLFLATIINCERLAQLSSPSLCPTKLQVHLNNNCLESLTWIFHRHLTLCKS